MPTMAQKVFSASNYRDRLYMANSTEIERSSENVGKTEDTVCAPANPASAPAPVALAEVMDRLDVETARRVRAEEALREAEERFRQLSERTGKFLWISDPQTDELLYVSPGYEEVWERTREGTYSSPEQWRTSFKRSGRPTITPGDASPEDQIYQVAAPDGTVRWIRDRMFPLRDGSGNVQRVLGIAEDVTDIKVLHDTVAKNSSRMRALVAVMLDLLFRIRKDGMILEFPAGLGIKYLVPVANLV